LLASRINAKLISVGDLVQKEKLYSGIDKKRDTLIANMEKVSEKLEKMITDSVDDIIVEGHFAVDMVSPEKISFVFVLRRNPQELRDILEARGYKEEKVKENLAAEILDVCLVDAIHRCGVNKVCEVDVTARKAEDIVAEIMSILERKKECRAGIVDWLGKLESEGKLEEYLEKN